MPKGKPRLLNIFGVSLDFFSENVKFSHMVININYKTALSMFTKSWDMAYLYVLCLFSGGG